MSPWEAWRLQEAWRLWELHSCVERHGGHLWTVYGEDPIEGCDVTLKCSYCGCALRDLGYIDGDDLICGTLGCITIEYGLHDWYHGFEYAVHVEIVEEISTDMNYIAARIDRSVRIRPVANNERRGVVTWRPPAPLTLYDREGTRGTLEIIVEEGGQPQGERCRPSLAEFWKMVLRTGV